MLMPEDIAALVVTVAKLPPRAVVPEIVVTPLYQDYA
jgi:NADP-dependent 3-hydroxy acid dehydrogenase YdfG